MSFWAELDKEACPCEGSGWGNINSQWEQCPLHFAGQLHPDSKSLLLDDPLRLAEAEKNSVLDWKIEKAISEVAELQAKVRQAQYQLHLLELERINKTPTVKIDLDKLPVNCYPTVQMKAVKA